VSVESRIAPSARAVPRLRLCRVRAADAEEFLRLEQNLDARRLYHPATTRQDALREIRRTRLYFLKLGEELAGTAAYRRREDGTVEISNLAVQPAYRGRGIARQAMEKLLAMNRGAPRLDLITHPENAAALALYLSLGFTVRKSLPDCFGDGEPRLQLVRPRVAAHGRNTTRANKS
jgi:ribosomal protein S18 acetylase RimI-like enzyme